MEQPMNDDSDLIVGINVVPLVDIVLVLLIVFMATASLVVKPAIDMELPSASTGDSKERNQFSLLLGKDGAVVIGDRQVDEARIADELEREFDAYKERKRAALEEGGQRLSETQLTALARSELTMIIQADVAVSHGRVIGFIDMARKTGILKYAFNVDPSESGLMAPSSPSKLASREVE